MGHTYEVWSWETKGGWGDYEYVKYYGGEDQAQAIKVMEDLKSNGAGCVKFYWRG